tara:strand:- start:1871 stop:2626 length:756 start_codon:yes stop_codon:yes gene_type:complete
LNIFLKNGLFRRFVSILFLILIWEIISSLINDKIILPTPIDVAESIKYHASQDLFHHVYITLLRVFVAFFLAMFIGSAIGIAMGRREKLDDYFDGWLILALNVPALVTIILCFIWFGLNEVAAILAVAINKIPTVTVILREGTKAIDEKLVEVGKVYNLKRIHIIKEIVIPQLFPYFISAARSGLALIWKIVLVVELLGRSNGVGFKINEFFSMFDTTSILAYTLVFVLIIMSIEWLIVKPTEKKLTEWRL